MGSLPSPVKDDSIQTDISFGSSNHLSPPAQSSRSGVRTASTQGSIATAKTDEVEGSTVKNRWDLLPAHAAGTCLANYTWTYKTTPTRMFYSKAPSNPY